MCRLAFLLQGLQRKMLVWVGLEGTMFLWQELQIFHLISLLSSASVTLSLVFWFQPCFVWQSSYHCEVTNESLLRALSHVLSTICGTVSKTVKLLVKKEAKTECNVNNLYNRVRKVVWSLPPSSFHLWHWQLSRGQRFVCLTITAQLEALSSFYSLCITG